MANISWLHGTCCLGLDYFALGMLLPSFFFTQQGLTGCKEGAQTLYG
jgi:hypothetical protein